MLIAVVGLSFVAYALASLAWATAIDWTAMAMLLSLAAAFALGLWMTEPRKVLIWHIAAAVVLVPVYIAFPWANPNYVGAGIALAMAFALAYNWYLFVPFALLGLLFAQSRGAIIAAGVVGLVWLWSRNRLAACATLALALVVAWLQRDLGASLWQRMGIWQDTLNHLTLFGHGWGGFYSAYADFPIHTNMTLTQAPHAYNDLLELVFDLGVGAALPLFLVLLCLEGTASKLPVVAFGVLSLTYFPLYIPVVAHLAVFYLGHLARSRNYGTLETSCRALHQHKRHRVGILGG